MSQWLSQKNQAPGLYDPRFEHDNCGIGAVVNIKGIKSHKTVEQALHIVENIWNNVLERMEMAKQATG